MELVIEVVSDAAFALDLVGEGVEDAAWPWPERWNRPYDWKTDGIEPSNQGEIR